MTHERRQPENELILVSRVCAGEDEAWRVFCEVYSPVIERSIRRYVEDYEIARDLYVSLLERLKKGKLESFGGKCTLAGWLFTVVRNHCMDYFRSSGGVRHVMKMLEGLAPRERRFFELFYIQGLSLPETYESMRSETNGAVSYGDLLEFDDTIRRKSARGCLERLTSRLMRPDAVRRGEILIESMPEGWEIADTVTPSPEDAADAGHAEKVIGRLNEAVRRLPPGDRLILKLKFERGLSARRISEILGGMTGRQVYARIEKLCAGLRAALGDGGNEDAQ